MNWRLLGFLVSILIVGPYLPAHCEDMLSRQSGTAIPPGAWTQITPGGPFQPSYLGYDNFGYNVVSGKTYVQSKYKDYSSEFNGALFAYSGDTNRWDFVTLSSTFHDEAMVESGHWDNRMLNDPTTGYLWLLNGSGSGSNGAESSITNLMFDPISQQGRVGHPFLRTFVLTTELAARMDYIHGVIVQHGAAGTAEFNVLNNTWGATYSGGGGAPPPNLQEACMVWNTADQSIYLFGGVSGGVAQNILYKRTNPGAWTTVTTGGTPPAARAWAGCGYDTKHNKMLVAGGCSSGAGCSSGMLNDSLIYDFGTSAWSGAGALPSPGGNFQQITNRLTYDERMDAFVAGLVTVGGANQTWVYRLYGGQNFGYKTGEQFTTSSGNISHQSTAYAKKPWVAVGGGNITVGWPETGIPSDGTASQTFHPFAANIQSGTATFLPNPATYNAMSTLAPGHTDVSEDISCVYVGATLWCSWTSRDSILNNTIFAKGWDGAAWSLGGAIGTVSVTSPQQGHSVMLNVAGVPTIVFQEIDRSHGLPWNNYVYAKQCTGSPCTWGAPLGGVFLNRTNNAAGFNPIADSISAVVKSGSDFFVAWSEYNSISSSQESDSAPNVYVSCWCAGAWTALGGSLNLVPGTTNAGNPPAPPNSGDSAYQPSIRSLSGVPYVAMVEINNLSPRGLQKLYVRGWTGAAWVATAGPLNVDPKFGWAANPVMTDDGASLYVGWVEQGAGAPWTAAVSTYQGSFGSNPHVYVDKVTTGGGVTRLAGMLNAGVNGSAIRAAIDITGGVPIVAWSEMNFGTTRQIYAKQFNSSSLEWTTNLVNSLAITTTTFPDTTIGDSYSQAAVATGGTLPYVWAVNSGSIPTGMNLNTATGMISGVAGAAAVFTFTLRVTDAALTVVTSGALTITVHAAPSITTASPLPNGTVAVGYSQALAATAGTPPYSWSVTSGVLPGGLSLASGTGIISGTPTTFGEVQTFQVTVTDSVGITGNKSMQISINGSPGTGGGVVINGVTVTGGKVTIH